MHCVTNSVKGSDLGYMSQPIQRKQTAYSSVLMLAGAVMAGPEPMLTRLERGCIALAFTARVAVDACMHRLADALEGGELSYLSLLSVDSKRVSRITLQ